MGKPLIGFIGQGWIGKNYANDFENRGYQTVRYALEEPYIANKDKIKECDIVIIAVPTPTTPKGFDSGTLEATFKLVGMGKIAVVKSTILPGSIQRFQKKNPDIVIVYSPEFLSAATAAYDAAHPFSNIIGLPVDDEAHRRAAEKVLAVMPAAPFTQICSSTEAEIIKYTHNASAFVQIVMFNIMYDIARKTNSDWEPIRNALEADPYISNRYARPVHQSGGQSIPGRGAGGGCFIKDFAALRELYSTLFSKDVATVRALESFEKKNIELLRDSKKDLDLLKGVYGASVLKPKRKIKKSKARR